VPIRARPGHLIGPTGVPASAPEQEDLDDRPQHHAFRRPTPFGDGSHPGRHPGHRLLRGPGRAGGRPAPGRGRGRRREGGAAGGGSGPVHPRLPHLEPEQAQRGAGSGVRSRAGGSPSVARRGRHPHPRVRSGLGGRVRVERCRAGRVLPPPHQRIGAGLAGRAPERRRRRRRSPGQRAPRPLRRAAGPSGRPGLPAPSHRQLVRRLPGHHRDPGPTGAAGSGEVRAEAACVPAWPRAPCCRR